ncbi:MAG TPA: glutamate racemase, partial [Pseudonocardia sp.]|nr:glutamate racemase [Pseudonocardia sp.]
MPDLDAPIGIFDSGVGGLTVARAVWDLLPNEAVVYLGDGAHFPYGPRPVEEIRRFAMGVADHLVARGVKALVVACNSIEVSAIGDIAAAAEIPVL